MGMVVKGIPEWEDYIDRIATITPELEVEMLNAMADVIIEAEKETARSMLNGPYTNEAIGVAQSIRRGRIRKDKYGHQYTDVIFYGKQVDSHHPHGERRASIAFVNEYGAKHHSGSRYQNPRPFISVALTRCNKDASDAAAEVFQKHINKQ